MHFFLHARTRSVFAEITNKNKCNLFTRNCDARLHFFARINFVYLSICCCALFASLTWFFFLCFACTHPHAYQDVCVCACCLFLLSCPIWDSLFFFGVQMEVFLAHAHPPTLLLSVLPSSWMCCGLGCLLGLLQFRWHHWPKSSTLTPFFFFLSGISDNSHFCTRGCLFFSPERCHVLIDRWIKNKKSNYLFIYLFSQKQNTGTPQCYRSPATKTGTAPSGKIKARKIAAAGKCVT